MEALGDPEGSGHSMGWALCWSWSLEEATWVWVEGMWRGWPGGGNIKMESSDVKQEGRLFPFAGTCMVCVLGSDHI